MEEPHWVKDRKPGSASLGKWGFSFHPAPPPSWLLVDVSTADPAHQVDLYEAGSWPFPWACRKSVKLLDTIMIQRWDPGSVECPLLMSLPMFSRAMYQDADIYLLDDPLSTVDAGVSRHLFEQWVCSYFLSSLLSRNPVEIGEESSGKPRASGNSAHSVLVYFPPLPSLHRRSIIEKFCIMMKSQENREEDRKIEKELPVCVGERVCALGSEG